MRRKNRNFEIFNLSFLDLISCGFGAVVLLILISKPLDDQEKSLLEEAKEILSQMVQTESDINAISTVVEQKQASLQTARALTAQLQAKARELDNKLNDAAAADDQAKDDVEGLELVEESLKRATITPKTNVIKRDEEVGGIPVDSDYVIFIVDTSGSMQVIWNRVRREMQNVLSIHPKVKGFQILNDNGIHLISTYNGRWIPDTAGRRKNIFGLFSNWKSASNSSPIEGLQVALKKYARPNITTSIYILGDDYTGSTYTAVIDEVDRLNTNRVTGKRLAKIHAIGFISIGVTNRFGILMREITKRNGGTFLALPK